MNPISALRAFITPDIRHVQTPMQIPDVGPGKLIPVRELESLKPRLATQTVEHAAPGDSFEHVLGNLVNAVSDKQAAAGDAVKGVLTGQNVSLHQAMIAMEEASVSFQLMVEVRNKLLESYQELMRMQV